MQRTLLIALMLTSTTLWAKQDFTGSVGAISNQVADGVGDVNGNRYNMDLSFDYHRQRPNEVERRFTFNALVNDQSSAMYSVNEAYVTNRWGRSELQVGRFQLDWSDVDSHWGFGKVNNRQNFTGFDPGQEGLVGVVFKRNYANGFRFHSFVTPLFVP